MPGAERNVSPSRASPAVFLTPLEHYGDHTLLLLRVMIGTFLVWGVSDNLLSAERMQEFASFLDAAGFPVAHVMAPLSVWAQFLVGVAFILGVLTRWAGVICIINFAVALVMVDSHGGIRAAFPSACLIVIGAYLATNGAGRFSIDAKLKRASGERAHERPAANY